MLSYLLKKLCGTLLRAEAVAEAVLCRQQGAGKKTLVRVCGVTGNTAKKLTEVYQEATKHVDEVSDKNVVTA